MGGCKYEGIKGTKMSVNMKAQMGRRCLKIQTHKWDHGVDKHEGINETKASVLLL